MSRVYAGSVVGCDLCKKGLSPKVGRTERSILVVYLRGIRLSSLHDGVLAHRMNCVAATGLL